MLKKYALGFFVQSGSRRVVQHAWGRSAHSVPMPSRPRSMERFQAGDGPEMPAQMPSFFFSGRISPVDLDIS